ncbi:MAG: porin [Bacteroidota bacterium]
MKPTAILLLFLFTGLASQAQEKEAEPPPGNISVKIYSHFNYSLDGENATAFEVKRAYFGYKRSLDDHFWGEVKLDIGSVDDDSEYALIRRYTYFKNAYLGYKKGNVITWFGLMDMLQFKVQENFWGYRYLYRSYMDEYKFGSSADLGAGIQYSPSKIITTDLVISNGEGYKKLQLDKKYRVGAGITLHPLPDLTIRGYYTVHTSVTTQMSFAGFVGYRFDRWRVGGEYILQKNHKFIEAHDRNGYSLYSTFIFSDKWELFARYDQLHSNILPPEDLPWNLDKDGSAVIAGVQFTPIRYVHMALNFQDWIDYAADGSSEPYIFLNLEVVF